MASKVPSRLFSYTLRGSLDLAPRWPHPLTMETGWRGTALERLVPLVLDAVAHVVDESFPVLAQKVLFGRL